MSKIIIFSIILIIVCIVAVGISAEMYRNSSSSAAQTSTTPIQTTTIAQMQDPIIGNWRQYSSNNTDARFRFNADNTFIFSFYDGNVTSTETGTWINQGNNTYVVSPQSPGKPITMIYNSSSNSIQFPLNPTVILKRWTGTVMTASTPKIVVTTSSTQTIGQFPSTQSNGKRQVTIYSVQKVSTYNWLGTSNSLTQKSKSGKIYIIIDAEVKYLGVIGIDSIYTGSGDFSLSDIEGTRYDAAPYIGDDAVGPLKELFKNQKTRGVVVFEVPTTAKGLTLFYDYGNLVPWGEKYATWEIN